MFTTETPIGELISYIHKNKNSNISSELISEVNNIVDLSTIRIEKYGLIETLDSLKGDLFNLRLLLLNNVELFKEIYEDISNTTKKWIAEQFDKDTKYYDLELAFVNTLNIYGKIAGGVFDDSPNKEKELLAFSATAHDIPNFNYESFTNLMKVVPGIDYELILNFLEHSLSLDFSLLISELVFDNTLKINKSNITGLTTLLKNSTEAYALSAFKLGIWKPQEEDESQWIRNIKIRISLEESIDNSNKMTFQELNKFFNS